MPAPAAIRDSFFGHLVHYLSNYKLFQHPEEVPGSPIPARYLSYPGSPGVASPATSDASSATLSGQPEDEDAQIPAEDSRAETDAVAPTNHQRGPDDSFNADVEKGDAAKAKETVMRREISDSALVDWYGPDDPENPYNWSLLKKCFFTFQVCFLTFSVYIGASIYAPGSAGIADQFGISETAATLGLTLFVAGYGVGPMFLSPLSEVPQIGRTTVYIICLVIFVAIQVPTALAKNLGALLPLRFLAGFVGSPALATGGASLGDIWAVETRSVSIGLWSLAGACGPTLGPLIGGFAVQYKDWTWSIWILLWLSGGTTIMLFFFLPETYDETILYRRASRLRRLTGNPKLKSRGEIELENTTIGEQLHTTLIRPFILGFVEPIVIFWNLYITLVYSIVYIFIESFPVVFIEHHGFTLGQNGLAFLGLFLGALCTYPFFVPYGIYVLGPKLKEGGGFVPEDRLPIAMVGAVLLPISLFWFGWTSGSNVHWIVPIIASSVFLAGTYLLFQAGLNYLPDCYPRYSASVLASNDFFRSFIGAAFPLFSTAFFHNLGVGPACSILAGISILMLPLPFVLYRYGARIRAMSKYTGEKTPHF